MTDEAIVLYRNASPNKYDQVPFMSKCQVTTKEYVEVYMQMSKDSEKPLWELVRCEKKTLPK